VSEIAEPAHNRMLAPIAACLGRGVRSQGDAELAAKLSEKWCIGKDSGVDDMSHVIERETTTLSGPAVEAISNLLAASQALSRLLQN
jgi:hypothetical protein